MFPVEIWAEIFDQLLYEPALANPNPFYPGCNPHTALIDWFDQTRLRKVERQRRILRLVSQTWKAVADRSIYQFYETVHSDAFSLAHPMLLSASRIHLDVEQAICCCSSLCTCVIRGYATIQGLPSQLKIVREVLQNAPADFQVSHRTLMVSFWWWIRIAGYDGDKSPNSWLSQISALFLAGAKATKDITNICPRLTFLSIQLLSVENSPDFHLSFPELTSLVIHIPEIEELNAFKTWDIPKLQHLWITHGMGGIISQLNEVFETKRPCLLSLGLRSFDRSSSFPHDIWSQVPSLLYIGFGWFYKDNISPPPNTHPLRILAFLQVHTYRFPRGDLGDVLSQWKNIEVVADVHRWEDFSSICPAAGNQPVHVHGLPVCFTTADSICSQHGIRYEDRHGRTFAEFKASSAVSVGMSESFEWFSRSILMFSLKSSRLHDARPRFNPHTCRARPLRAFPLTRFCSQDFTFW